MARPFIKWVGGKRQLLPALTQIIPAKIKMYYEPFVGGGAVFWHLAEEQRFEQAILNDANAELVNLYMMVQQFPDKLIETLQHHMTQEWNTQTYFTAIRAQDPSSLGNISRAARFIYLNKTAFNGLYRVNKSGQFNAPFGRYTNPTLLDEANLRACSQVLYKTTICCGDFVTVSQDAGPGDVVYFDPPYVPVNATSNFTSYTAGNFSLNDQHRLALQAKILVGKGATVLVSNSDTETTRMVYAGLEVYPVQARRNVNSKGDGRGCVGEVILVGRPD